MKIVTLGCIAILTLSACDLYSGTAMVRPVTLVVKDNGTGLPLSDITVYYRLRKAGPVGFVEVYYKTIELKKLKTDSNGEITIPLRGYALGPLELFQGQSFYINLDTKDGRKPTERDLHNFSRVFISSNNSIHDSIVIANKSYYATVVYFWDNQEKEETTNFSSNFYRYDFEGPFSGEKMNVTVMLAKN